MFAGKQPLLEKDIRHMATSFEQLIIANLPSTRRYARALTGDSELANEAVLHAITKGSKSSLPIPLPILLANSLANSLAWVPKKLIRLWLVHLVHEYVDKHVGSDRRTVSGDGSDQADTPPYETFPTDGDGGSRLLIHRVDASLKELSEQQRRIYLLIALESFAIPDVALLLKLEDETVRAEFESIRAQLAPPQQDTAAPLPKAA